jgi:peptidylprolyl isomerase
VTYFKILPTSIHSRAVRSRVSVAAAALGAAILIAGCGSSGGSSTITIGNENTTDNALIKASETTSTASTSTTAKTPTSGPLSKEPTVTPPKGPAPAKLETKELITGTGAEAKAGSAISVNDVGVLFKTGTEFESSFKRDEPFTLTLGKGQVIPGWEQGIPGMKVGGRRELIIPASLAYGVKGSPPKIPANETLVFVIDLLSA